MHHLPKLSRPLIAVTLLMLTSLASAQVYKWTDAGGTVHFSEAPPAQGVKFDKVKTNISNTPSNATATAAAPVANGPSEMPTAPPAPETVPDTEDNRQQLCASLKANMDTLQKSGPVVVQQGAKQTLLDADQRKQQAAGAQSQYDQYCRPK